MINFKFEGCDVVYNDAGEREARAVILYGHTDNYLYFDADHENAVNREDLLKLCKAQLVLVSYSGSFYTPISFKDNTTDVSVVIATAVSADASASVTLKSKEPA